MSGVKSVSIALPGFADGMNTQEPSVKVGAAYRSRYPRLQCSSAIDAILSGSSIKRRPGMSAINHSLTGWMRGLDTYLQEDGTDTLLTAVDGKIYSIDKISGAATLIYEIGGAGEVWFSTYQNKCWVCNGSKNIKIEGSTGYTLAINPPTDAMAIAGGSGSLTAGEYTIFVCYARKVDGVTRLYSTGQALTPITLSGTNAAIIWCADSADLQVTTKIVFMSDAGGSAYYFYGEFDQGTETLMISDTTARNPSIIYDVVAADNTTPPAFSQILAADNRIWGVSGRYLYYSLQSGTVYDLERFGQLNYIEYPFQITSIHATGLHLYINTPAGIIRQPNFDVTARFEHVEKRYYFKYPRTVAEWSGTLIGLTEDGVRIFDGDKMSSYDVSLDVKPDIQKAYTGASGSDFNPIGTIYRRAYRTEYHLCYRDLSVSTLTNNRRLVLNLDHFSVAADNKAVAAWEKWTAGANYLTVDGNGTLFSGQSTAEGSTIYTESVTRAADSNIYVGNAKVSSAVPALKVITGTYVFDLSGKVRWMDIRLLAQLAADMTIEAHILAYPSQQTTQTVQPLTTVEDVARFGIARFGIDRFAPATPTHKIAKLPRNIIGYAVYFVINQVLEDKNSRFT
jgi:hypothetical protein